MKNGKKLKIVLAGQANVGKSVIFNYLTGLHQHIGNWPGKTVEKAEGTLFYKGYTIDVFDLPGIYALTTYSLEEIISRDYIALRKPDFVVNVVDSTNLERNLLFTLQLLELERPVVLALNMVNLLKEKGIEINIGKLQELLQIPVVPVAAIYGKGITEVLDRGIELVKSNTKEVTLALTYKEIKEIFMERKINPDDFENGDFDFDGPKKESMRIFPISGGVKATLNRFHLNGWKIIVKDEVVKLILLFEELLQNPKADCIFYDVLACRGGCLGGSGVATSAGKEERKRRLLDYLAEEEERP